MRNAIITFFLIAFCIKANGQITISKQMDEAIKKAIEKSQDVKNKQLEIEKIEIDRKVVMQKYIPTVEANATYLHFNSSSIIDIEPIQNETLRKLELSMAKPRLELQAKTAMENGIKQAMPSAIAQATQQAQAYITANGLSGAQAQAVLDKAKQQAETQVKAKVQQAVEAEMAKRQQEHLTKPYFDGKSESSSYGNIFSAGISAKMVLFSGMQIPYGNKALNEKKIGTQYLIETSKEDVAKDVITSFDQLRVLDVAEELIKDSKKRLEIESDRLEKSIKEGMAIPMDKDKIELAQLELQAKELEIEGNRNLIYQKIEYLTGMKKEESSKIVDSLEPFIVDEKGNYSVEEKAEMKALNSFVNAQEYVLSKEKGTLLPQVALFGGVRYTSLFNSSLNFEEPMSFLPSQVTMSNATLFPTFYVGVGAKWQIFSGFARSNKINQAKIDVEQIKNKREDVKEKLNLLINKNLEDYKVANKKLLIYEQKMKIAKNTLDTSVKQYKEGMIDISERLATENDFYKISLERAQGIAQQRLTGIELERAKGSFLRYNTK